MIHLTAVILAGLVYDVRGFRKCAGKILGRTDSILLSGHGSLDLHIFRTLKLFVLKGKVKGRVFQFQKKTVKYSFARGSGGAGSMTENQNIKGSPPVWNGKTADAIKAAPFFRKSVNRSEGETEGFFGT